MTIAIAPLNDWPANGTALDAQRIASLLHAMNAAADWQVRVETELASSNSTLIQEVRELHHQGRHLTRPILLAVETQTAGRGRQGRSWHSAPAHVPGASLTASFAWPIALRLDQLAGLSLVCGLAVRAALRTLGLDARLKWPNDVLLGERKLGGILVEVQDHPNGVVPVIGIGINVGPAAHRAVDTMPGLAVTDLATAGVAVDRNQLAAALACALSDALTRFTRAGFADFAVEWNAAHAYRDQAVQLIERGAVIATGLARGVDDAGELLLETERGLRRVMVGDVSLRPETKA